MASPQNLTFSPKEIAFIQHPDALLHPEKAALDVGYSQSFSHCDKPYLLRKKHIHVLVEKMRERLEQIAITPEWVQNEVAVLARTAPADFIEFVETPDKQQVAVLKPRDQIPDDKWRAAIKEIEFQDILCGDGSLRSRVSKLIFYDRQRAIMDLAKLLGLTNEHVQLARLQQASAQKTEEDMLLESMTPEELEQIASVQEAALERIRNKAGKKRDRNAIEGKKS